MKEEDKKILHMKVKRVAHLGILVEGFSTYSNSVMPTCRKLNQDKRCVSYFRNTRNVKTNLALPLVRDTFSLLGSFMGGQSEFWCIPDCARVVVKTYRLHMCCICHKYVQ